MQVRIPRSSLLLALIVGLISLACTLGSNNGPPRNAAVINVTANTSLTTWLAKVVENFNQAQIETTAGKPVYVEFIVQEEERGKVFPEGYTSHCIFLSHPLFRAAFEFNPAAYGLNQEAMEEYTAQGGH